MQRGIAIVASLALHLGALAYAPPPAKLARPVADEALLEVLLHFDEATVAQPQRAHREGHHEAGGRAGVTSTDDEARFGLTGPQDNPDPHIADTRGKSRSPVSPSLGFSGLSAEKMDAPVAPWGRRAALGNDRRSAVGNMFAEHIGAGQGAERARGSEGPKETGG